MSLRIEDLKPVEGSKKSRKRIGRGVGSGHGRTACKGGKGQTARSGGFHKRGFEGGQMPLQRRLPKFGFHNLFRKDFTAVNLSQIDTLPNTNEITPEILVDAGFIKRKDIESVKILGNGNITKTYKIKAHGFSKSAKEKIEKQGGKVEVLG
jgi:large subunit ribosomal protein L15